MANQYLVPQFIDVEDKIFGPVTVRQFILMLTAALIMFIEYKLSDFSLFLFLAIITAVVFGIVAFYKVNGMPFHFFLLNIIETLKKPSIRIWDKSYKPEKFKVKKVKEEKKSEKKVKIKELPVSQLADLTLLVNTGGLYKGQVVNNQIQNQEQKQKDNDKQEDEIG